MKTKVPARETMFDLYPAFDLVHALWDKGYLTDDLNPEPDLTVKDINYFIVNELGGPKYKSLDELRADCAVVTAMLKAGAKARA
jgi:hypothetical protein